MLLEYTPEIMSPDTPSTPSQISKPQRVLACLLCQKRKIKCTRQFPCSNCIKSGEQCLPSAVTPRQRKRRFPERALLERLRKYEDLLRQNSILFEPLHKDVTGAKESPNAENGYDSDDGQSETTGADVSNIPTTVKSERIRGAKYVFLRS